MRRTVRSISMSPRSSSQRSSEGFESKWSSIALRPVAMTMMICSIPDAIASSTAYWMIGRSTSGSTSLGIALVAGRNRVPNPAAGRTAFLTRTMIGFLLVAGSVSGRRHGVPGCGPAHGRHGWGVPHGA
jgi:hypothetical protein